MTILPAPAELTDVLIGLGTRVMVGLEIEPSPTPSPTDVLRPGLTKWDVSPGLVGFLAMFAVALAGVAVWFSMAGKLRKIRFDERRAAAQGEHHPGTPSDPAASAERAGETAPEGSGSGTIDPGAPDGQNDADSQ